jgi:Tol biopolymer transport system component/DNA-binding winged helix-turn-helix (wHTH) protein
LKELIPKSTRRFYAFGPFRLYVAEREVFRGGAPVNMTPKAVDALLVLVSHHGHIVDKQELMKVLWPDSFVEEDSLVKQISVLRKVLGDSPDGQYIETIPTRGYRFTARVTESWAEQERSGAPALVEDDSPAGAAEKRRRRLVLTCAVAAAALVGLLSLFLLGKGGAPSAELSVRPLTSYPGNEAWPSFSPDANQIVFAWRQEGREDFDIYLKTLGSDKALQVTNTPDSDIGPAWSPDGQQIAFDRTGPDGRHAVYVISPLGGPERLVSELEGKGFLWPNPVYPASPLAWSPDGKWLAYRGIWLLSPATGEKRRLTSPPPGFLSDAACAFSPDGRHVAFVRRKSHQVDDVYVVPAAGGEPKRLTMDERGILGLCWTTDGREIVFSSNRSGERALWRVPASGGTPRRIAEAGEHAWFPSISRQGERLAFTRQLRDLNVWQVESPGTLQDTSRPARLIASTKADEDPQFSPDGKRIGFTSDRSGTMQVWVCSHDGSNALQLTSLPGSGAQLSAWSPDGRSIAFNSAVRGNWDIYVVPADGGVPRRLTAEGSDDSGPSWSRDGRSVYFGSNRTGRFEVWKVPSGGGTAVQVTRNGGYKPVESGDGKFVYYTKGPAVFDAWKVPVQGGEETPVLQNLRSRWALWEGGLYLFEREADGRWFLKSFDFATRGKKSVVGLPGTPVVQQSPSISPDGRAFLYAQWDVGEADLVLVENFR